MIIIISAPVSAPLKRLWSRFEFLVMEIRAPGVTRKVLVFNWDEWCAYIINNIRSPARFAS